MILTKKNKKKLLNLIAANQIITNSIASIKDLNDIQAFTQFCENSSEMIFLIGGVSAVEEARDVLFKRGKDD